MPSASPGAEGNVVSGERPPSRRQRFRRFRFIVYGVTALLQVVPALGASVVVSGSAAAALGALALLVTLRVLGAVVSDGRRPAVRVVVLDEPVLAHWCASLLATLLFLPSLPAAGIVSRLASLSFGSAVRGAAAFVYVASLAAAVWGFTAGRRRIAVTHVEIPIVGLDEELDGYRILQVSDLHIGNFDTKDRGFAWAARVNALAPDLVAVTGDLVTAGSTFYPDVAAVLGRLSGKDGVFVSLGNHDQSNPDALAQLIALEGPTVLRNSSRVVSRGAARLVVAGLDDRMTGRDDLARTLSGRVPGAPTVLLSHYPDFFEEAASAGVDLVLSGHTHGGQIGVPFFSKRWSLSRLARQHAPGLHIRGHSRLYVNAGLGTTGPPVRFGVAPEISVFTLRSA
ncbi:MAG TPA: metallophosphoesterase [Polyangiaceae bacterium]|nr:metallophosphoesterase [Polyangiaceae bacterium]